MKYEISRMSFSGQGMSAEEVAKRTMFPIEVVKQYESCFDK